MQKNKEQSALIFLILGLFIWEIYAIINIMPVMSNYYLKNGLRVLGLIIIVFSRIINLNIGMNKSRFFIFIIIVSFLGINNILIAKDSTFLDIIIIVICTIGYNYTDIINKYFYFRFISLATVVILSLVGVLSNQTTTRFDNTFRVRYSLGFYWPSFAPFSFLFLVLYYIWSHYKKFNIKWAIFFLICNQLLYKVTDTKMAYFLVLFSIFMWFVLVKSNFNINNVIIIVMLLIPILLLILSVYLSMHYAEYDNLNSFFSGRLGLGYEGIQRFGIKWLGQPYEDSTQLNIIGIEYFTVDSGLLRYLLHFGTISTILMLLCFEYLLFYLLTREKNIIQAVIILIVFLSAFSDPWFLNISFNIFWIVLGKLVVNREE